MSAPFVLSFPRKSYGQLSLESSFDPFSHFVNTHSTMQLILLFLMDYTLGFLCPLMICNSTTDAVFASYGVYFLFLKNGYIMFILGLSNLDEKGF